jgi:hypothetical protein
MAGATMKSQERRTGNAAKNESGAAERRKRRDADERGLEAEKIMHMRRRWIGPMTTRDVDLDASQGRCRR